MAVPQHSAPTLALARKGPAQTNEDPIAMDIRTSVRSGDAKLTQDEARALRRVLPADAICRRRSVDVAAACSSFSDDGVSHPPVREVRSDETGIGARVVPSNATPRTRKNMRRVCPKFGYEERRKKAAASSEPSPPPSQASAGGTGVTVAPDSNSSTRLERDPTMVRSPVANHKLEGIYGLPGLQIARPSNFGGGSGENSPSAAA